jgi:hypothetical protein
VTRVGAFEGAVPFYEDELTEYRHPTPAQGYARCGSDAPQAKQGTGYNTTRRGALLHAWMSKRGSFWPGSARAVSEKRGSKF